MSKTINFYEGVPPTVNVALIEGGSLPITTLYYRVHASGYGDFYWSPTGNWYTPMSDEVSVTTTATHRTVWLWWDWVDQPVGFIQRAGAYRTEVSGNYKLTDSNGNMQAHCARPTGYSSNQRNCVRMQTEAQGHWIYTMTATSNIASLVPGETITEQGSGATALVITNPDGGGTFRVWKLDGIWDGNTPFDGSVSGSSVGTWSSTSERDGQALEDKVATMDSMAFIEQGIPYLTMHGGTEEDPFTPQELYNYLVANGKEQFIDVLTVFEEGDYLDSEGDDLAGMYKFKFNLGDDTGGENWFKVPAGVGIFQGLCTHTLRGNLIMGEQAEDGNYVTGGSAWFGAWAFAAPYNCLSYHPHNIAVSNLFGSVLGKYAGAELPFRANNDATYQVNGMVEARDTVFQSGGRFTNAYKIRNSRFMLSGEKGDETNISDAENAVFDTFLENMAFRACNTTYNNYVFVPTHSTSDVRNRGTSNQGVMTTHLNNCTYLREGGSSWRNWANTTSVLFDSVFLEHFDTIIKVIDENGEPIENVKISIVDKDKKKAIFDRYSQIYTQIMDIGKTGTSIELGGNSNTGPSDPLEVGSYYKINDEVVYVASEDNGVYTIQRGVEDSTVITICGNSAGATARPNFFYKRHDFLMTDENGRVELQLNHRYSVIIDAYREIIDDPDFRSPFKITIEKEGYETVVKEYVADKPRDLVITLKKALPVMTGTDGRVAVKVDAKNVGKNRNKVIII